MKENFMKVSSIVFAYIGQGQVYFDQQYFNNPFK